jgi:hypothetical protein
MRNARPDLDDRLTPAGRRALASFLAGRLPAGQLNAELSRPREEGSPGMAAPAATAAEMRSSAHAA